ncbi:MAG: GvpL/GvpF family gas vesicle protein [Ignavibacteriae bacterium]|nr:GvpL/GvpF family gas vesicle protein [Ignavibacteriota bacterium]
MEAKGIYIYGFVPGFDDINKFMALEGLGLFAIQFREVSAVVSDMETSDYANLNMESLAQLLIHHQKTIEELVNIGFSIVVPLRLVTTLDSKEDVLSVIGKGYDLILDVMNKIETLTEIDIVATWSDFSEILKKVSNHPDITELKKNISLKGDNITQSDQIEVGKLVKDKLDEMRESFKVKILNSLASLSHEIKCHEVMNDQMVINTAFLINRNSKVQFENVLTKMDEEFNGALNFKIVGPLPCYSFYTFEINKLDYQVIEDAKNELGLKNMTSEKEIKEAYIEKLKLFHPDKNADLDNSENYNIASHAYKMMLDYSASVNKSSKDEQFSLERKDVINNLVLLRIRK